MERIGREVAGYTLITPLGGVAIHSVPSHSLPPHPPYAHLGKVAHTRSEWRENGVNEAKVFHLTSLNRV